MNSLYKSIKRSVNVALFLGVVLIFFYVKADLPVHCKREEIEGVWTFRIETATFDASLKNPKTNCGHGFPDKVEKSIGDINFKFSDYKEIEVNLSSDYNIYKSKESKEKVGNWTPVYDEAFVAYYQNSVFTAFMKYYLKDNSSDSKGNSNYVSNCDKTMIGWYIPDSNHNDKNWSCFFGFKSKVRSEFTPNRFMQFNNNNILRKTEENTDELNNSNFIEMSSKTDSRLGLHLIKYDQRELVKELNNMNLSWKADIHEEFKGLSFFQLKEKLGLKRNKNRKGNTHESFFNNNNNNFKDSLDEFKNFENSNQPVNGQVNEVENIDNILNSWSSLEVSDKKENTRNESIDLENPEQNKFTLESIDPSSTASIIDLKAEFNKETSNNHSKSTGEIKNKPYFNPNSSGMHHRESNQKISSRSNQDNNYNLLKTNNSKVEEDSSNVTDPIIIQKYIKKDLNEINVAELPKNWDW